MMILPLITPGAGKMMVNDPHGLTLTLISLMVVFGCLLVLYCVYALSDAIFSGKFKRKAKVAAQPAGGQTPDGETEAAIATALHLYLSGSAHDKEAGIITIKPRKASGWTDKTLTLRKKAL